MGAVVTPGTYCREVESYLCRKNDGHLIRIVGPAFDLVCGWAERDIPLRVVYAGIDRTFARYYAKPGRRRPVRIEFCEHDVLDGFDQWRRALGVRAEGTPPTAGRTRLSLPVHVGHVSDSLAAWCDTEGSRLPALNAAVLRARREVEALREPAGQARGAKRGALIERLATVERELVEALRTAVDPGTRDRLRVEATRDLEPFRLRMASDTFRQAVDAGTDRLLWQQARLPPVAFG